MNAAKKDHEGLSSWWGVREVDFLFGQFKRYTRFVFYGKWSLVSIALILVAALIIWPFVGKDKSGLRISFVDSKTAPASPEKPVMTNPEYRGTSANGREYKVAGTRAIQETQDMIVIEQVEAVMMKPDGGWQVLTADKAEYYKAEMRIELLGNVVVIDNRNNEFKTARATVDVATMDVTGKDPVEGMSENGKILATGFEMRDKGNRTVFHHGNDRVKVTSKPSKRKRS